LLPEYIRRLNREPAFRGQAFSALNVAEGKPDPASGTKAAAPTEAPQKAQFHEFVLVPVKSGEATKLSGGRQG
jgi:hypothetical protein